MLQPTISEPRVAPRAARGGSEESLFVRIRRQMSERILKGVYGVGERLPSEAELAQEFGASRQTVSKAIAELARCGLVERNRRAGTVVTRKFHRTFILPLADIRQDVRDRGLAYGYRVLDRAILRNGRDGLDWSDVPSGEPLVRVEVLHLGDDAPLMLESRLINIAAAPAVTQETFERAAPSPWLLANIPWTSVDHRIAAVNCGSDLAGKLDLAVGTACPTIERRTFHFDVPVTRARMVLAGSRLEVKGSYTLPTI
ncbi:UTRA domain-containing protein [Aureimonas flava]|uniref:UTRA domain-containing protein n=1 Tax=Aureimonas flava TaxID=2320271 RepID=A0A3A1WUA0_9HYPH|nr:UTRA domain-containing protein [Aureimonas flava]RIY02003.1 UTRA domain-containing protein [Aureimonas flava]